MIDDTLFAELRDMRWGRRYERLAELCRAVQTAMPPGLVEGSTRFSTRLYPRLMDREAADIKAFHHWLRTCAVHGAALGCEIVTPTRGFAKGRPVKKWLWGRGLADISQLV